VAVMSLAVALYWSVVQQHRSAEVIAKATAAGAARSQLVAFEPPQDADYLAAHAALERTFNSRLKLLAPATRARVEADLEVIRRANEDLRSALAHDPASPLLLQLLHSTSQQEIDLYTSVAQSTEPLLMRRTKA
jgi:phage-related baseplate assembly protein